jgi:hypothetical protein
VLNKFNVLGGKKYRDVLANNLISGYRQTHNESSIYVKSSNMSNRYYRVTLENYISFQKS